MNNKIYKTIQNWVQSKNNTEYNSRIITKDNRKYTLLIKNVDENSYVGYIFLVKNFSFDGYIEKWRISGNVLNFNQFREVLWKKLEGLVIEPYFYERKIIIEKYKKPKILRGEPIEIFQETKQIVIF